MNQLKLPWWLAIYVLIAGKLKEYYSRGLLSIYFTSYLASIFRVLSWAIVAGMVYRFQGHDQLAILMLLRGAAGLINVLPVGFASGLVHALSKPSQVHEIIPEISTAQTGQLEYERRLVQPSPSGPDAVYSTAVDVACWYAVGLFAISIVYSLNIGSIYQFRNFTSYGTFTIAFCLCLGMIIRSFSEVFASRLQAEGKQTCDNICSITAEVVFVATFIFSDLVNVMLHASQTFLLGSVVLAGMRYFYVRRITSLSWSKRYYRLLKPVLVLAIWAILSQFSDWLYAPFNQILMDRFIDVSLIGFYTPAIQIDGALLLLIAGISVSLFPLASRMFHNQEWDALRNNYLRSTMISFLILAAGALFICLISNWLFIKWFGKPMLETQAILPFVLIHTVIGGTASIGRSVLFGMGRMKPYAIASIIGGVSNAILATLVVILKPEWGLMGIIGVTIFTVTIRCAFWLPWYTLRAIRQEESGLGLAR